MRKLIITENVTVDGVIDAAGDWFGPAGDPEIDESDQLAAIAQQRQAADAFLVGRVTFEEMRSFWPAQADDTTGITNYLNNVSKYVVSTTLTRADWQNTTILNGNLVEEIRGLKDRAGGDIVATGSISLVHQLIAEDLVDEYRLFLYPVVIGEGARLFSGAGVPNLELLETRSFRSGVVLLRYLVAR